MGFNLSDEVLRAHISVKSKDSLFTTYLLSLGDGTTFNIIGGKARQVRYTDSKAILQFEKVEDVRKFQLLEKEEIVLLNGEVMTLNEAYGFIGTNYIPTPEYQGEDDSDEIRSELLSGRAKAMKQNSRLLEFRN